MARQKNSTRSQRLRRRKRYSVNVKRLLLIMLSLMVLALLIITLFSSPTFAIRKVLVTGNTLVPAKEVLQRVNFVMGGNVFLIKEEEVAAALKQNPIVATAHLRRKLPTTLLVQVIERKPHFVLNTGTALYEVDPGGLPYRLVKTADPNLSMIVCRIPGRVIPGKSLTAPAFVSARNCLLMAESRKVFGTVKITIDPTGYLCLNVQDRYQVKIGQSDQLAEKLDVAKRVVEQVSEFRQRGLYIDVTCPREPAFKLRDQ